MLRRAALYGVSNSGAEWQKCYSALLSMLEERFGAGRVWQRTTKYYDDVDVADDVAVAIILGLRDHGRDVLERCRALGIPTIVIDLGWLRRSWGYWQASVGELNVAPPTAPSGDRFEKLQLSVFPIETRDYSSLIVGQIPGDAQHDLATERDMINWATNVAEQVKALKVTDKLHSLYWRPHPGFVRSIAPYAVLAHPERNLQEFIRDHRVGSAVVYNSTLGLDLLRNGIRVVAQGPRTVYTDLVSSDIQSLSFSHPGPEVVRALLERLAYGQYQVSELSNWSTLERIFELHGITGDW